MHTNGVIKYCGTCYWKEIQSTTGEIIYKSDNCQCTLVKHSSALITICKKTNTISYSCRMCLLFTERLVKHIYVYPIKGERDYDPFYACPLLEKRMRIPSVHNSLPCAKCHEDQINCMTIGLLWMCYKCTNGELELFTTPNSYLHINDNITKNTTTISGVSWMCARRFCTNISYFNDSLHFIQVINCTYCKL